MFVAFQFSRRRFRHQMAHPLVLMWKQMLTPPPPRCSVWEYAKQSRGGGGVSNTHTEPLIVRFWNGRRYTTSLLIVHLLGDFLTVDCWYIPEWNQWDSSWGRKEKDTPVRVESESNLRYFTVLWRLKCLHVISFRQICALTPNILFPSPPTQRSSRLRSLVFKMDTRK